MTPELRARITARNETAAGFAEVKRDAIATANAIEASGTRAAAGLAVQNRALAQTGSLSRMAAMQQRNLIFQLNDIGVSLASGMNPLMVMAQQGSQIATIWGPEEGGIGRALKETGNLAVGLVTKFWPVAAAAGAVALAVGGITSEINKTAKSSVSSGDVVVGAFQLLGEGVLKELNPIITWFGEMWDLITPYVKDGVNFLIGSFTLAYDNIKTYWSHLPAALGDITVRTVNGMTDVIEDFLNENRLKIAEFMANVSTSMGPFGATMRGEAIKLAASPVSFDRLDNPWEGGEADFLGQMAQNRLNAFGTDWVGEIGKRAETVALLAKETDKAGAAAGKAVSEYAAWADDGIGKMIEQAEKLADTLAGTLTDGVMSVWNAFRSGENVLEAISNKLMSFADQMLEAGIQSFFRSILGGGLGSSGWNMPRSFVPGGFFPGFATGGDFTVGGSGGTDSQLVAFRATPGEEVSVRRPGQGSGGMLQVTVVTEVRNGNLVPVMARVAGEVAGQRVNQQAPLATAKAQRDRRIG